MKKFLFITIKKDIFITLAVLILTAVLIYLLFVTLGYWKDTQASTQDNEYTGELNKENEHLRGALESILPKEQKILYENPYRPYGEAKVNIHTEPLNEVVGKGKELEFSVSYKVPEYMRPVYDPSWLTAYYRGWLGLRYKIEEARHRLFIFPLGGSATYDFMGSLGFEGSPSVDAHRNINFLIYHFEVEAVKLSGHQLALVGKPRRTGVQVIAVNKDHLFPVNEGVGDFLIQLSTPEGYEIDFIYEKSVMKYEFLKKHIEEHSIKPNPAFANIKGENSLLKKELSRYVPVGKKEVITEQECSRWAGLGKTGKTSSLKLAYENGIKIDYKVHYQNMNYKRPVYHPEWMGNCEKGWCYIPEKICENLHVLFGLPGNISKQSDLLGRLGFFEKYKTVGKGSTGLLIYNFIPDKVVKYNNQIVTTGVPGRTGAVVISFDSSLLVSKKNYLVQLSTPDFKEFDYEVLTAE